MHTITIPTSREAGVPPAGVICASGLTRRYGEGETAVEALGGVSLAIARGRLTARPALFPPDFKAGT